ncbi:MAG TPA: carboxylesterase family protein [Verrucomicrobiae bacterium]|nr:carboxylesterase family protein [Verrucomicrobiae bacterium]
MIVRTKSQKLNGSSFNWSSRLALGIAVSCMLMAIPATAAASGPLVAAKDGVFQGVSTSTMNEFLGIRYAQAPVGDLRWKAPRRPERSAGIQDATKFGNHCPQPASPFGLPSITEDCLFLNVFTPAGASQNSHDGHDGKGRDGERSGRLPVMFWMHGGALVVGESDDYNPQRMVAQGVIVVTINYRLGALGFLAHPALSAEAADPDNDNDSDQAGGSGNYGIMDQQLALKWVKRNIEAFGGDPGNVTIFGESAGGLSTFSNLVSPRAHGLFDRAIVESGAYRLTLPSLATAESQGTAFATAENCTDQTAACLRALTVAQVLAKQNAAGYATNIDGRVLPQSIGTALASGQFNRVPVMNGTNHDEWRLFVALNDVFAGIIPTPGNYPQIIAGTLGIPVAATGPIVALYPPGPTTQSTELALGALGTDAIFACPAHFASALTSQFVPTFAYELNDENAPQDFLPFAGFPYGAAHASEIQYLFDLRPSLPVVPPLNANQQQLAQNMVSYWTEFAEKGNPNQHGTPGWLTFNVAGESIQSFVPPTPVTESNFAAAHHCAFWDAATGRTLP